MNMTILVYSDDQLQAALDRYIADGHPNPMQHAERVRDADGVRVFLGSEAAEKLIVRQSAGSPSKPESNPK